MFFIHHPYLINLILLIGILGFSYRVRSLSGDLTLIFVYLSLHYSYGLLPIFLNDQSAFKFYQAEHETTGLGLQLIGFFSLGILLLVPMIKYKLSSILTGRRFLVFLPISLLLCFAVIWFFSVLFYFNWTSNSFLINKLLFIQAVTLVCMLVFSYFCICLVKKGLTQLELKKMIKGLLFLSISMTMVAIMEVFSRKTWICCAWIRPSAFLFNPNNLAFWYLIVGIVFEIAYVKHIHKKISAIGLVLSSVGIFMTGSRSIFLIFLATNLLTLMVMSAWRGDLFKRAVMVNILFLFPFLMLCVTPHLVNTNNTFIADMQKNATRFILTIPVLYQYVSSGHAINLSDTYLVKHFLVTNYAPYSGLNLADSGVENISGRLSGSSSDNAYIFLYKIKNWLFLIWISILLLPIFFSVKKLLNSKNTLLILVTIFYISILISGMTLNIFLVFPSWLILAGVYGMLMSLVWERA